ncbi:helix-turn-helix domain-containing protein [Bdellovibrio bacteriovorus]|uniref:HTH cro/C1-type domain-containing protein n=1 Tax=Bdellovibrio bacteriovorus str. Tiberius TaxID=1069642 RepID=K7ZA10_BDEBC|nr:helix-turn-helix transcriptional regulator [Bdellovibrio bacteriovorus]AFY01419.1 hypothetical protein Bdt_1725 [Bdellovibrio bacteriovorus str. Tiberius]
MKEFKSQKIKAVLKVLLKKKGLTYDALAEQMECSVPTIKRILGPEELTLNRLLHLCDILDTNLAEIETLTAEEETGSPSFTEEQDAFLAKNKNYFAYLMKLFDGMTPKQIADEYQLTARSTDKYLIGLEKHDLIRVTGKQKVKPAFKTIPNLGNAALARAHSESFIKGVAYFFIDLVREGLYSQKKKEERNQASFSTQVVKISKASYQAWVEEQNKSLRSFEKLATYEEKTKAPEELMSAVIVSAHTILKHDYEGLKKFSSTFGEITNF